MSWKFKCIDMKSIHKRKDLIGRRVRAWFNESTRTHLNHQIVGIFRANGIHEIGSKVAHEFSKFSSVYLE